MPRTCIALLAAAACGGTSAHPPDAALDAPPDAPAPLDFTETYDTGTADVGGWLLTTSADRIRTIETSGGNPDGFLYGEVSLAVPAWSTASTRFQPTATDSVFVGDFYASDLKSLAADLDVIQAGNWSSNRTVTLHLMQWNAAANDRVFEAFYSLPDIPTPPTGWTSYRFTIAARSPTIPPGWQFLRGDGSAGTNAEWATFMKQIDLVELQYGRPGYLYPSTGVWDLGIDNIHITALP